MSADDGAGKAPYRPRRVGPPGPNYQQPPRRRWRRKRQQAPQPLTRKAPAPPPPAGQPAATPPAPAQQPPPNPPLAPTQPQQAPQPPVQPPPPYVQPPQPPPPQAQPQQPVAPPPPQQPAQPPEPPKEKRRKRRSRIDLFIGIPLGLILGVGIVTAFVFLGSEGTIDAPRISGVHGGGATGATSPSGQPTQPPSKVPKTPPAPPSKLPVVEISGGAPPTDSGAPKIAAKRGRPVSFRVVADVPLTIEIVNTRADPPLPVFTESVSSGDLVTFTPKTAGQFATFVSGNDINVATFDVSP